MVEINKLNRREFLRSLGALCGAVMVRPFPLFLQSDILAHMPVPVPPSLMLHSADGRGDFLPRLLEALCVQGYTGTTYQEWQRRILNGSPIANPLILSIDDISAAQGGCPSFATFTQMKEWIRAAGMTAVYGVITEPVYNDSPQRAQDEARWDMLQSWVEDGFELATHTTYHSNFNARDTGPRPDFTAVDYEAEICDSARLIETKLRERGLGYAVQSLILPYGSGYAYLSEQPAVHPGILAACTQTQIRFVVGIVQGREPLLVDDSIAYVGRLSPVYTADPNGQMTPLLEGTLAQLHSWRQQNEAINLQARRPLHFPL